ncbi:MAG TPA: AraC family transcriptional regulator [Steroidobacter sp.]
MILRRTHEMVSGDLSAALARQPSSENTVVSLHTQVADYTLDGERFALLSAWGGRQEVTLDNRRIAVDDDTWLPIPSGSAAVRIRGPEPVNVLTVLFRRGMPEEVLGTMLTPDDRLLDEGEVQASGNLPFIPHLQTHDRGVTPVLLFIRRHCEMGLNDPLWFEEQFAFLLERMLARHRDVLQRARGVPVRRAATRREILRRVSLATDFIHSNFDKPLMLGDMAKAAFLSRHHFLRLFKHIHDVTPHEYLQRKRTTVAGRLLRGSELAVEDIVKVVGFDSRSTLFRALRRFHGVTPRECRRAADSLTSFMGGMGAAAA